MPATDDWMYRVLGLNVPRKIDAAAITDGAALTDGDCLWMIRDCKSSWKQVKAKYLPTKPVMKRLVDYRKSVVNGIIGELDKQWGERLIAKAVGSDNLTSDYDITFTTKDGDGSEIDAVVSFNDEIKRMFGVPPGVCFDTNLYVKDFLKVEDKSILGTKDAPRSDAGGIDEIDQLKTMDLSDQDVGALTKQRQYMDAAQWDAYREQVLAQMFAIEDDTQREAAVKETTLQFEEAESTYLLKAAEKVNRLFAQIEHAKPPPSHEFDEMMGLKAQWAKDADTEKAHALVDKILKLGAEHFEAATMEASNELYMEKMFAARDIQQKQKQLEAALAKDPDSPRAEAAKTAIDALRARAKKEITDANFFAAEAYLSEGPLQHIVGGRQGGDAAALEKLKPEHLLGSINEQFGDFMKDCGHYAGNEGEAFCQTSKYIERMLNGIVMLRAKKGFETLKLQTLPIDGIATMAEAISALLLPIRGAKDEWAEKSDEERFAAAAAEAKGIYGVSDLAGLKKLATALSVEINVAVRAATSAAGGMRPNDADNAKFFANRGAG